MLNYYNVVLAVNVSPESHKDKTHYKQIYSRVYSNNYNRKIRNYKLGTVWRETFKV